MYWGEGVVEGRRIMQGVGRGYSKKDLKILTGRSGKGSRDYEN